jgi:hypothetical protein
MNKETLRMQMLAGVITESEYKQKLEEKSPFSGKKMDLSLIKNIEWPDFVLQELEQDFPQIDFKTLVIGSLFPEEGVNDGAREAEVVSAKDLKGNDVDKKTLKKLNSRNRYEIIDIVLNNWDPYWKSQKKKKSLNEHYVAGGIVGIGAINQIPSRAKADYEDAFEHFLGQKYNLNEMEDDMPEAPSHEETDAAQVYEANPLEGGPGYMTKYRVGVLSALIADAEKDLIKYEEEGLLSPELTEKMKGTIEKLKSSREALKAQYREETGKDV